MRKDLKYDIIEIEKFSSMRTVDAEITFIKKRLFAPVDSKIDKKILSTVHAHLLRIVDFQSVLNVVQNFCCQGVHRYGYARIHTLMHLYN